MFDLGFLRNMKNSLEPVTFSKYPRLKKIKLYVKKILKKEINIKKENIIIWKSFIKIDEISFTGRNPPEEIIVIARFSELNDLIPRMFRIIKIDIVKPEYNRRILIDCFKISAELKDKKLVKDFFKLSS